MRAPRLLLPLVLGACLAPIFHAPAAGGYQHVRDGGFEDGSAAWASAPGTTLRTDADAAAPEGSRVAIIDGAALARLTQSLPDALPAGTYDVSLAARTTSGESAISLDVIASAPIFSRFSVAGTASRDWSVIAGQVTLPQAAYVTIVLSGDVPDGASLALDDVRIDGAAPVSITPTPTNTPGSVATQGGSATALASTTTTPTPTATVGPTAIASTLRNASFEEPGGDGAPAGWEQYGGNLTLGDRARTGAHSARVESTTDSTKWLHQALIVEPGATYDFGAWILNDDANVAAAFLRVSWYDTDDASGTNIGSADSTGRLESPSGEYRYLSTGPITAPAGAHSARARILLAPASGAHAAIYADDASWQPASPLPLPAATTDSAMPQAANNAGESASRAPAARSSGRTRAQQQALYNASEGGGRLLISEVMYDPDGDGADAANEWVEVYNPGPVAIDLADWRLADAAAVETLPPLVVPAHEFAIIAAADSLGASYPQLRARTAVVGGRIGNGLGNDSDHLLLIAPDGAWADAVSWGTDTAAFAPPVGDVPEGHSIERTDISSDTDSARDFADNPHPSPGTAFDPARTKPQQQNAPRIEIIAGNGAIPAWLPWAIAAGSLATLAGVGGWRAFGFVRQRVRP